MRRGLIALVCGCGAALAAAAPQDDPATAEGWERRGHELRALADRDGERGRLAEAERAFDRAIELGGEAPLRLVARGLVRRLLGEGAPDPVHRRKSKFMEKRPAGR